MRKRSATGNLLILAGSFLAALSCYGQVVNGSIVGTITDASGGVVPNAAITVTEVDTGLSRALTADSSGYYTVPQLPPGTYTVSAEKPGFATGAHTGITLHADSTVRVDITLQTGAVAQQVTVSAESVPMLQTDTAQTGGTLGEREVADLPLDTGHNFQTLVSILPGAGTAVRNNSIFYNPENSVTTAVNGFPGRANHFNIEGVSDNEVGGLIQAYIPFAEAIQEVNISTSNYDPAEGGALGAVTNVILKSGTNHFHGEAYEFYNGNKLNANNFFAQGVNGAPYQSPHSVDNNYGANVGGPIQKDKTFFFFNFTEHPQRTGYFYILTVPTMATRNGNFSDPALTTVYDPATGDGADCLLAGNPNLCGTGRQPFPGNIIPSTRLDAVAQKLLTYVSPPNANLAAPGFQQYENNFLTSSELIRNASEIDVKIDRNISQRDLVMGRFGYAYPTESQPGAFGVYGGPIASGGIGGVEGTGSNRTFSTGINWVHTFSPTLLSEARIGLIRFRDVAHQIGYGQDLSTQVGIPGANVDAFTSGLSSINISGVSDPLLGIFNSFPWELNQTNIDFINNWSKTKGGHTLQWGLDYHRIRDNYLIAPTWPMGGFNFTAGPTSLNGGSQEGGFANAFASFLLGIPNSTSRGYSYIYPSYRQNYIFPYVGDRWQVSPKLTLNFGLRWEYYGPPTPAYAGGFSDYDPTDNTLRLAGLGSTPRDLGATNYYHNFAPRAGAAYRLTQDSVVRAGFGMSYMTFPIDIYAYWNYPIEPSFAWNSTSSFGPALLSASTPASLTAGFPALPPFTLPASGIIQANTPTLLNQFYYDWNVHEPYPYVMAWNVAYERALPVGWVLDIAYVGNRSVHSPVGMDLNASTIYGAGALGQPEFKAFGRTASTQEYFAGFRSAYDSLQVKLDHKFAKGFSVTTSYTYGKAMGYVDDSGDYPNNLLDYVNLRRNWAPTDFNQTHTLHQSFIWQLPFGKGQHFVNTGLASKLLGGWQFSGFWQFATGFPLNFSCDCPAFNTPSSQAFPNITGPFKKLYGIQTQPWFDTSAFSSPPAGTQGNVGEYISSGPNFFNLDASIFRTINLTERFKLEFRSEWFHATNTPQFSNPDTNLGDPNFGLVSSATGARMIDFVTKLIF
jgi:outer membrane receptor protein involved in Fe transport